MYLDSLGSPSRVSVRFWLGPATRLDPSWLGLWGVRRRQSIKTFNIHCGRHMIIWFKLKLYKKDPCYFSYLSVRTRFFGSIWQGIANDKVEYQHFRIRWTELTIINCFKPAIISRTFWKTSSRKYYGENKEIISGNTNVFHGCIYFSTGED